MGTEIHIKDMKPEYFKQMKDHLNVKKKRTFLELKLGIRPKESSIKMYKIIENPIRLVVPFFFYKVMTSRFPNENKPMRHIDIKFRENLYENQYMLIEDILERFIRDRTIIIDSEPGTGKTVISIYLATLLGVPIFATFNRRSLMSQWINTFKKFTNAKILVIDDKVYKLYKEDCLPDVYICMYSRISLFNDIIIQDISCVIFDEIHLLCTREKPEFFLKLRPNFCIGLSATPDREDNLNLIMNLIVGVSKFGLMNNVPLEVMKINTNVEPEMIQNKIGGLDWSGVVNSQHSDQKRYSLLLKLIKEFNQKGKKILVLTSRRNFSVQLCKDVNEKLLIKSDFLIGGKDVYHDSNVLVCSYQKGGVGFDEQMNCVDYSGVRLDLLILYFSTKSLPLLEQLVGRILRCKNPKVVDLVDKGRIFQNHFRERMKYYETKKLTLTEFTFVEN